MKPYTCYLFGVPWWWWTSSVPLRPSPSLLVSDQLEPTWKCIKKLLFLIVSQVSSSPSNTVRLWWRDMVGGPARASSNRSTWNEPPFYMCVRPFSEIGRCLMSNKPSLLKRCFNLYIGPSSNDNERMASTTSGSSWRAKRIHIHIKERITKEYVGWWWWWCRSRHWTRMCSWCINVFPQLNLKKMEHIDSISFILKVSLNVSTWPKRVCKRYGPSSSPTQGPKQFNLSFLYFCFFFFFFFFFFDPNSV